MEWNSVFVWRKHSRGVGNAWTSCLSLYSWPSTNIANASKQRSQQSWQKKNKKLQNSSRWPGTAKQIQNSKLRIRKAFHFRGQCPRTYTKLPLHTIEQTYNQTEEQNMWRSSMTSSLELSKARPTWHTRLQLTRVALRNGFNTITMCIDWCERQGKHCAASNLMVKLAQKLAIKGV